MNLIGKMFIVLIFIMSIMFMGASVFIYATHTNWKARCAELQKTLDETKTNAKQLVDARDEIQRGLNEELSRRASVIANLTTKVAELDKENAAFKDELAQLKSDKEQGIAAVKLSHETQASLRAEVDGLRKNLRSAQEDWAKLYSDLVAKTDEAHGLALQLSTYRSVGEKLTQDYQDAVKVLQLHDLVPDPARYNGVAPAGVQGEVTEVRPNGWLEISIGSDSGLMKGHRLDVVRNLAGRSSYIGKIEITETQPDRSVAKILTDFRRGTVQRGDVVENIATGELSVK